MNAQTTCCVMTLLMIKPPKPNLFAKLGIARRCNLQVACSPAALETCSCCYTLFAQLSATCISWHMYCGLYCVLYLLLHWIWFQIGYAAL